MIRSAVAGNEVLQPLITRQIYFALLGVIVIFIVASMDYRYWLALYRPIYFGIMIFLVSLSRLWADLHLARSVGFRWVCCFFSRLNLPRSLPLLSCALF